MEKYEEFFIIAKEKIQVADHMITMTFPLVKDPKILFLSLQNIFLSMTSAIKGILTYERLNKRIPPYSDTFEGRILALNDCSTRYGITKKHIAIVRNIRDIITEHQQSPVEFTRDGKFVICSPTYKMKILSLEELKAYIRDARLFVHTVSAKII
jgi:hypothetical protein